MDDTAQAPTAVDRSLTLVSETPAEDGMIDLVFEMDPAFQAELQELADRRGKDLSTYLRDALLKGMQREIKEGIADGRVAAEEAAHLLDSIARTMGEDSATAQATPTPDDEHPGTIGAPV